MPLLLDAHIAPERCAACWRPTAPPSSMCPATSRRRRAGAGGLCPGAGGGGQRPAPPPRRAGRAPPGAGPPALHLGQHRQPQLVRLSGRNLDANTRSIVEYLELDEGQRPVTNLAMSYSYGMSIVNTHLLAGRRWCSPGAACWSGPSGSWWSGSGSPPWPGCPTPTACTGGRACWRWSCLR
ncbi:MAG: hypothetical protein ACLRIS_16345 [Flavonifractor plautii]